MTEAPRPVLSYASAPRRSRWPLWTAVGVALALPVAVLLAVRSSLIVRPRPIPLSAFSSAITVPQASISGVQVPYRRFVLLHDGQDQVALRLETDPERGPSGIRYEWFHAPDGACDFGRPVVSHGKGETHEANGTGVIAAGPFRIVWSQCSRDSGWVYRSAPNPNLVIYKRSWATTQEVRALPPRHEQISFPGPAVYPAAPSTAPTTR